MTIWLVLRSIIAWVFALLATVGLAGLSVLASLFPGGGVVSIWCMRSWARAILLVAGVRWQLEGREHLDFSGNVIITSNHQAALDILVLAAAIPFRFFWVAKKELFRIPFLGWHMRRSGYIPIDRGRREKGSSAMTHAEEKLRSGGSLLFFPEGTRSLDGNIQRFKRGAFELSLRTGVPLLPLTLVGSREVLRKRGYLVRPGLVRIVFAAPVAPQSFAGDRQGLTAHVHAAIVANYQKYWKSPAESF